MNVRDKNSTLIGTQVDWRRWLAARLHGRPAPDQAGALMVFSLALRIGAAALTLALDRTVFRTAHKQLAQADGQEPQNRWLHPAGW